MVFSNEFEKFFHKFYTVICKTEGIIVLKALF
jgi:hypothetical protein